MNDFARAKEIIESYGHQVVSKTVQTYNYTIGHGDPLIEVKIEVNQGITVTLPLKGDEKADVYIERVQDTDGSFKWQVNVSPDSIEIKASVNIEDTGAMTMGGMVLYDPEDEEE